MPDPDTLFAAATAELFGDVEQPLGEGNHNGRSTLVPAAADTNETGGAFGFSPSVSSSLTPTQRLAAERRMADLQRRQVDAQPYCPDYP